MKKFLLSAAALVCAASVNAQVFQMNAEDFGITSEASSVFEGMVFGPTTLADPFTISNAFTTDHKAVDCKNNDYNQVIFNGTDVIVTKGGVQGQDNPKDIDGQNPGVSLVAPATGAVVKLYARQDGYVYIVAKLSSNKNYYVFEEGTPIGFTLAMEINDERFPENKIVYTVEGEGELNEIKDATYTTNWPVRVALKDVEAATAGNGLGVIGFPVYADCEYLIGAGGSKISWCGAYFTSAPCSVTIKGDEKAEFALLGEASGEPEGDSSATIFQMNGEDFGFSADATPVFEGKLFGPTTPDDPFSIYNAFTTDHKLVDCKNNDYNQVIFNGTDVIVTKNGIQGQDNPKDIDGQNPGVSLVAPATGAVIKLQARQDGYVYIVAKLSSNKNYYVFEEGTPVGFTLAMEINDDRFPSNKIAYTVEGEGELNEIKDATYTTNWPVRVALKDVEAATAGNGLGVIGFPVYADCNYLIGAGGSKISWCGAYFTSKPCSVSVAGDEKAEFSLLGKGGVVGIETIEAEAATVAGSINLFGQKTNAATGFMIKNGAKVYVN